MDLISRQAAIDALNDVSEHYTEEGREWHPHVDFMVIAIKHLPSAQPEQRKGKWISDGQDIPHGCEWMHCSICGGKFLDVPMEHTNFCPNCGAYMGDEQ